MSIVFELKSFFRRLSYQLSGHKRKIEVGILMVACILFGFFFKLNTQIAMGVVFAYILYRVSMYIWERRND